MDPLPQHALTPDVSFDGGDLDCGGGLLLLIRRYIDPMERGQLLEIISTDASVEQDLPSWCRLTSNELLSWIKRGRQRSYLVCKGSLAERSPAKTSIPKLSPGRNLAVPVTIPEQLPQPATTAAIEPLSIMGMGSWPRPRWMLE